MLPATPLLPPPGVELAMRLMTMTMVEDAVEYFSSSPPPPSPTRCSPVTSYYEMLWPGETQSREVHRDFWISETPPPSPALLPSPPHSLYIPPTQPFSLPSPPPPPRRTPYHHHRRRCCCSVKFPFPELISTVEAEAYSLFVDDANVLGEKHYQG